MELHLKRLINKAANLMHKKPLNMQKSCTITDEIYIKMCY